MKHISLTPVTIFNTPVPKRMRISILAAVLVLAACSKGGTSTAGSPSAEAPGTKSATAVANSPAPMSGPLRLEGNWKVTFTLKKATKGTLERGATMLAEMAFQPQCESGPCDGTVTVTQIKPKGPAYTTGYRLEGDTYTWESKNRPNCTIDGHDVYYRNFSKIYRVTVSGDTQGSATSFTGTFVGKATASGSYKGEKCTAPFVAIWDLTGKSA